MRYVGMYHPAPANQGPPTEDGMARMGALVQEMMAEGALIVTEPLGAPGTGARIERVDGGFKVSALADRPGGYAILQADSLDGCIEAVKTFLSVAGDGVCEIRQIVDMG